MSIDISAKAIPPIRQTYGHVSRRIGEGKPASRYQEATYDLQATTNFHYRPLWDKRYDIYDVERTAIVMKDWYAFRDPRQYYYSAYTAVRAKQQEIAEKNYAFVEQRELLLTLPAATQRIIRQIFIPLRHVEWGANMNNCAITDCGYGTAITQASTFNSLDRLGIAQYLTRVSLILEQNETTGLDAAKQDWLERDIWQDLRHVVEDTFVLEDWFETMVAQNIVMDGLVYPLIYQHLVDELLTSGATVMALLTQFMTEWFAETERWTNALIKVTAAESDANKALLSKWAGHWNGRVSGALVGIADNAFEQNGKERVEQVSQALIARLQKQGI